MQTASGNKRVITAFLHELVERGFPVDRPLQAAYAHPTYADAKRARGRLHRERRVGHESAAA